MRKDGRKKLNKSPFNFAMRILSVIRKFQDLRRIIQSPQRMKCNYTKNQQKVLENLSSRTYGVE